MSFTTLIPAYKAEFLVELLTCIRRQSLKPERIIFSDDSPNAVYQRMLTSDPIKSKIADLPIEVIIGPKQGHYYQNIQSLLAAYLAAGKKKSDYFHILLDDDLIYPTFYEQHLKGHTAFKTRCVISRRWLTVTDSDPAKDAFLPPQIANNPNLFQQIDSGHAFSLTVGKGINCFGEFSNTTYNALMAEELSQSVFDGVPYIGMDDLGSFLRSSMHSPLVFINQHLGIFRKSDGNNSSHPKRMPFKQALIAWFALAIVGKRLGKLNDQDYLYALAHRKANLLAHYQKSYTEEQDMQEIIDFFNSVALTAPDFPEKFMLVWSRFLATEHELAV